MEKYLCLKDDIFTRIEYILNNKEYLKTLDTYVSSLKVISDYAVYGVAFPGISLGFMTNNSALSGSYFIGNVEVLQSIVINSDIRGDELKKEGDVYKKGDVEIPIRLNEKVLIKDSLLLDTLVHNCSHDLEDLELFLIKNTIALNWSNIHGCSTRFSIVLPLATVDLSVVSRSIIGEFSYVQASLRDSFIEPGTILIESEDFIFKYRHPRELIKSYVNFEKGTLKGEIVDFLEQKRYTFKSLFNRIPQREQMTGKGSFASPYAVYKGEVEIAENVLVSQKAYLEDCFLGKGANAQENCYIINSHLSGYNVSAHGAKIINTFLEENTFVGFNSYLKAKNKYGLKIGTGAVIMPHTIIDLQEDLEIPAKTLVWGIVRNKEDLQYNSCSLSEFAKIEGKFTLGNLEFEGKGEKFISAFSHRIEHILEANGAFFDGQKNKGHAQNKQEISFNLFSPFVKGEYKGLFGKISL